MRILVTGGAGYVGSHTALLLRDFGHEVTIYDNLTTGHRQLAGTMPLVVGDISHVDTLTDQLANTDAVLHFAASAYVGESVANPRKYFQNNVESALKLMDAVLASDVRMVIFSSTCAVYGNPPQLPIFETLPTAPINPYGDTKLFFEKVLSAYSVSHGVRFVALRYFNASGADPDGRSGEFHEIETHVIPLAFRAILGTAPPIKVFGNQHPTPDGSCIRDFIHVSDLADAHLKALQYLERGGESISINLSTGRPTSVLQLLSEMGVVTGRKPRFEIAGSRPGDPPALYANPDLAKNLLGWQPRFGLDASLETAWRWETEGLPRLRSV